MTTNVQSGRDFSTTRRSGQRRILAAASLRSALSSSLQKSRLVTSGASLAGPLAGADASIQPMAQPQSGDAERDVPFTRLQRATSTVPSDREMPSASHRRNVGHSAGLWRPNSIADTSRPRSRMAQNASTFRRERLRRAGRVDHCKPPGALSRRLTANVRPCGSTAACGRSSGRTRF